MHAWDAIPQPCRLLFGRMATLQWSVLQGLIPDLSLWGGGLHCMGRGDKLDLHLDADRHPRLALERRANAILFVGVWIEAWGGQLELWNKDLTGSEKQIAPVQGRLVIFETSDVSYHAVSQPLACPDGTLRRSLALYWFGAPRGPSRRPRATFMAPASEPADPVKDQLRKLRSS